MRIHENVERIFRILEETNTKATFFIIGWIAKTYPELVRKIADKYQIGSHTMTHQLVWQQSRETFKEDVSASIKLLEDITGKKVECFRAPGFSIRESEAWAFETLAELGIKYDSSVFLRLPATRKFKSYVGLKGAENKLRKYLTEFAFTDIATAERQINWGKAPVVRV